jgi:hypothetical protein
MYISGADPGFVSRRPHTVPSGSLGDSIILAQYTYFKMFEMKIISIKVTVRSAVLCMGTMDNCPVVTQANEPHAHYG